LDASSENDFIYPGPWYAQQLSHRQVVAASLYIASRLASKGDAETGFLKRLTTWGAPWSVRAAAVEAIEDY